MDKLFINIYYKIKNWRKTFILLVFILLGAGIYTVSHITFDEDITKILPSGEKSDHIAKVLGQLNFSDKITVMIEAKSEEGKEKLANITHSLLDLLSEDSLFYTDIQGLIDNEQIDETFSFVYNHLPLFLDEEDYKKIEERLSKDSIDSKIQDNYNSLISPSGIVTRDFILKDPLSISFLGLNKLKDLGVSQDFIINEGFITTADSTTLLLFITPTFSGTDTKANEEFVHHLYDYQKQINEDFKAEAELTYYGSPFIALANAHQIKTDIKSTVVISILVLMLILILFYKKLHIPIILFIPAVCGAVLALTILYFINPSISAISISIGAILLGVTLDYSIHVITHYREHLDIKELYQTITKPLLGCSITTAIAFLCLLFVKSKVLQDLGVFAAISIVSASVFALIIIPHIYTPKETVSKKSIIDKLGAYNFDKNKALIFITLAAIIVGLFSFSKVKFNNNISDLNYVPQNMQESEKQLENIGVMGVKSIYLTTYGEDLESILDKNTQIERQLKKYKSQGIIKDYNSIGSIVLSEKEQINKINQWNQFWEKNKKDSTLIRVHNAASDLGFNEGAFHSLDELLAKEFTPLAAKEFNQLNALPVDEFLIEKEGFVTLSTIIKIDSLNYEEVAHSFEEENVIVIDRKHLNEQFLGQMRDDFRNLINYSLIVVFIILLLFFRRVELALLSITPIILTGIVTTGLVYIFALELNIFSTIVTTLILGIGVDFSIFMTSGLQNKYSNGKDELSTYRTSIILAVLTTLLSIGALVFAKHPALKSISWISLIGIISAMLITFTFYPLLFKAFIGSRPKKGKAPATLRLAISAVLSHIYFGLGGFLFSLIGLISTIVPIKKEKKQRWLRKAIAKFTKSVYYSNYGVNSIVRNPYNEKFEKPAIIIVNHSSFLDTLSIGFLPTNFTFLVNDWVYNSPIFGKAIQSAGYYPASSGLGKGEEKLIKMIKNGNSIVIFPEGTRSYTGSIGRFHKGAFFLAQNHNIDIVPLYIHGNSSILPKGDFIIFDGTHTLEIGKRIVLNEEQKEIRLRDLTKSISQSFRKRFQEIRYELEDENYFQQKIKLSFIYKTRALVKEAKVEFEENKAAYHQLNPYIKDRTSILRLGNDLGIWDMMLVLQKGRRKVYSYIKDEEKRAIARQNYLVNNRSLIYLDNPFEEETDILFITCKIDEELILKLLEKQTFKKIILSSNSINYDFFHKFGYNLKTKREYFFILIKG